MSWAASPAIPSRKQRGWRTCTSTLRRWVSGYSYKRPGRVVEQPPILRDVASESVLSFFDLLEAAFLAAYIGIRRDGSFKVVL